MAHSKLKSKYVVCSPLLFVAFPFSGIILYQIIEDLWPELKFYTEKRKTKKKKNFFCDMRFAEMDIQFQFSWCCVVIASNIKYYTS